jgi:hypothetical protein
LFARILAAGRKENSTTTLPEETGMSAERMGIQAVIFLAVPLAAGSVCGLRAETPLVVFDVPLSVQCRDVTPRDRQPAYTRKIIEAVFKISPQIYAGEEKDVKRLHYEISTEQQMPVVGFLPNAELATDVAGGTIAIQSSEHRGSLSFRYLILPGTGSGGLKGDLESSRVQYLLLAPKQLLLAAGTIDRGCGVFYDLRASTQDTIQRQREFACLFEVSRAWRADHVTLRCKARGVKYGFAGVTESEADCGAELLCVGLCMTGDDEARAYVEALAKKQQLYLRRLAAGAQEARARSADNVLGSAAKLFASRVLRSGGANLRMGAAVAAHLDEQKDLRKTLPAEARDAANELDVVKQSLRRMNGK